MALVKYAQFQQCDAGDSFIAEAGGNDEYRLGSADDERVLDTGAEADIVGSEYGDRGEYPVRDNDILRKSQAEMLGFFAVCKGIVLQTKFKSSPLTYHLCIAVDTCPINKSSKRGG